MWKLTWPKNRKGKRNVSPLHIHDWNPSAETKRSDRTQHKWLLCSYSGLFAQHFDITHVSRSECVSSVLQCVATSLTLHTDVSNCLHLSPLPYFFSPPQTRCCRWPKRLKWLSKTAYPLWGPADFSPPKLAACTGSRSGSSTGGTEQSLEGQKKDGKWIKLLTAAHYSQRWEKQNWIKVLILKEWRNSSYEALLKTPVKPWPENPVTELTHHESTCDALSNERNHQCAMRLPFYTSGDALS